MTPFARWARKLFSSPRRPDRRRPARLHVTPLEDRTVLDATFTVPASYSESDVGPLASYASGSQVISTGSMTTITGTFYVGPPETLDDPTPAITTMIVGQVSYTPGTTDTTYPFTFQGVTYRAADNNAPPTVAARGSGTLKAQEVVTDNYGFAVSSDEIGSFAGGSSRASTSRSRSRPTTSCPPARRNGTTSRRTPRPRSGTRSSCRRRPASRGTGTSKSRCSGCRPSWPSSSRTPSTRSPTSTATARRSTTST